MRSSTKRIPESIRNAPELHMGLEIYLDAFFELSSSRSLGMGPGPIPWTAVQLYGEAIDLPPEQMSELHYFIPCMDEVWIKHQNAKSSGTVKNHG